MSSIPILGICFVLMGQAPVTSYRDAIVKFGPQPPQAPIELSCPGRVARPRVDG